jgi:hypothetical protein
MDAVTACSRSFTTKLRYPAIDKYSRPVPLFVATADPMIELARPRQVRDEMPEIEGHTHATIRLPDEAPVPARAKRQGCLASRHASPSSFGGPAAGVQHVAALAYTKPTRLPLQTA